jgi:hypothetical protein
MPIVLALVILAILAFTIAWFLRASPTTVARLLRPVLIVVGGIGIGLLLIFGLRFVPSVLPELLGLAGVVVTALIARALRQRPSGGFSAPGSAGQRTEVRTAFLQAWIDHGSGDVGGTVLAGSFTGRTLDALSDSELVDLRAQCAGDADSLKILEAYLDRRLGPDWRNAQRPPPRGPRTDMTREEALAVLGLAEGVSEEDVRTAHRRLIQRVHPDVGGSADLAARINRAKDVLLGT